MIFFVFLTKLLVGVFFVGVFFVGTFFVENFLSLSIPTFNIFFAAFSSRPAFIPHLHMCSSLSPISFIFPQCEHVFVVKYSFTYITLDPYLYAIYVNRMRNKYGENTPI